MVFKQSFTAYYLAIAFVCLAISTCPMTQSTQTGGFTVDLIHRDSPDSPFYDPSLAHSERLANALIRSCNHVNHLKHQKGQRHGHRRIPQTDVTNSQGEYLMKYSIGSPPFSTLGIIDTGSDITWTQCQPCAECFSQSVPMFDPRKSSTYTNIPCKSPMCSTIKSTECSKNKTICLYQITYGDGSYTYGQVSTDTVTLGSSNGSPLSFPNISLGCGFRNRRNNRGGGSGIIGLGVGKASLVQQLGRSIQGKFSYCLVPFSEGANASKLHFGAKAVVSGHGVVSTPMVPITFYYLTLEAITIGNQRLEMDRPSKETPPGPSGANMIIDSGTTLTRLPPRLFQQLVTAVKSILKLKQVPDPQGVLDLCFNTRKAITLPGKLTFNFRGADLDLKPENLFIPLSETLQCLGVLSSGGGDAILGNWLQTNLLVGYDLQKKTVSFKPFDCTKA